MELRVRFVGTASCWSHRANASERGVGLGLGLGLVLLYHELLPGKNFADLSLCNGRNCEELLKSDVVE